MDEGVGVCSTDCAGALQDRVLVNLCGNQAQSLENSDAKTESLLVYLGVRQIPWERQKALFSRWNTLELLLPLSLQQNSWCYVL